METLIARHHFMRIRKMKGIKLYALLGSLTVAVACVPSAVMADEPTGNGAKAQAPVEHDRGVRLDDLFTKFSRPGGSEASTAPLVKPTPTHDASHTQPVVAVAKTKKNAPVVAKVQAKPAPGKTDKTVEIENAIAKLKNDQSNVVAVSHSVVSSSATPVISATLDRPGNLPKYRSGDHMVITLKALQECNVMVFDYDNKGTITQIYPNTFESNGTMHAGDSVELGGDKSQYTLDIDGSGIEQIFVYAYPTSERPIEVAMMTPMAHTPFRSAKITRSQYDAMIAQSREYSFAKAAGNGGAESRAITLKEKTGAVNISHSQQKPANKLELVFQIER
jgi:hypothetical protein